jgi:hypothetical protein
MRSLAPLLRRLAAPLLLLAAAGAATPSLAESLDRLGTVAPRTVGSPERPVLDGEGARDAVLDMLDSYELIFRQYGIGAEMLPALEQARASTLQIPEEQLDRFAEEAGFKIVVAQEAADRLRAVLRARERRLQAEADGPAGAKSLGFPALRTDVPEYPNTSAGDSGDTISEDDLEDQETEIEREDDTRSGFSLAAMSSLCDGRPATTGARARREDDSVLFAARMVLVAIQAVHIVSDRFCGQDIAGFSCSVCCIPIDFLLMAAEVVYEQKLNCEDMIDTAELEAAYLNSRQIHAAVEHVHGDVGTEGIATRNAISALDSKIDVIDGNVDIILDATTCHPVVTLGRGAACNGNDDDCDDQVDECDEDAFGPVVGFEEGGLTKWFDTVADAVLAVTRAVRVSDECSSYTVGTPALSGSCGTVTASVTVTDACGRATTKTTVVKIDSGPPSLVIPSSIASSCHSSVAAAEAAVRAAASISDDCTPAGQLDVRIDSTVTECNLRVRIEAIDQAGKRSTAATTVRVDAGLPRVEIEPLLLGFRSAPLGFQTPACWRTVAEAEAAVRAAVRLSDGCTATESLTPSVTSTGDPCSLAVTVSSTDGCGSTNSDSIVVRVDATPPVTTASVTRGELQPGNHEMVDVGFAFSAADGCSGAPRVEVSVTSDEPTADADGAGQSSKSPDALILRDIDGTIRKVLLRAERSGSGDGRVYQIHVQAMDACGNASRSSVSVVVRRNPGQPATDSGQFYPATEVN